MTQAWYLSFISVDGNHPEVIHSWWMTFPLINLLPVSAPLFRQIPFNYSMRPLICFQGLNGTELRSIAKRISPFFSFRKCIALDKRSWILELLTAGMYIWASRPFMAQSKDCCKFRVFCLFQWWGHELLQPPGHVCLVLWSTLTQLSSLA